VERGEGKALSLEDIAEKVRRAFYRQFASEDDDWAGPYLMEVYEAYGIASLDGEKYRVAYEMTADGITFTPREAWELVEKDWVPASVGAAAPLKDASTVVAWGEAVKALGDGRVGGYLVRFSTETCSTVSMNFDRRVPCSTTSLSPPSRTPANRDCLNASTESMPSSMVPLAQK
jgi:hypothetical protein